MGATIHYDVGDSDYYGDRSRWSATLLKSAAVNGLASAKAILDGVDKGSKAMREGWLAHLAVQFPDEFNRKCVVPPEDLKEGIKNADGSEPKYPERTKQYGLRVSEWEDANPNVFRVTAKERKDTLEDREALHKSTCWRDQDHQEAVVYFQFEGMSYKCRIDGICNNPDGSVALYDWKFVSGTRDFHSKIFRYGYHMQGALYTYAMQEAGFDVDGFYLVGVDKQTRDPAYTVCAPLSQDAIDLGLSECSKWHKRIEYSIATDYWPACEAPEEWGIPKWYDRD